MTLNGGRKPRKKAGRDNKTQRTTTMCFSGPQQMKTGAGGAQEAHDALIHTYCTEKKTTNK